MLDAIDSQASRPSPRDPDARHAPVYTRLFYAMPGLYLVLDPALFIVDATDAYLAATMTTRDGVVGRHLFDVFPDNPAEDGATGVSQLNMSLQRVLSQKRPDAMALQKYDVRKDGLPDGEFEERFWSPLNTPVFDEQGEISHILHRVEDVTEFVRLKGIIHLYPHLQDPTFHMEADLVSRAQQIQSVNRELESSKEELEAAVQLRTAELENTNRALREEIARRQTVEEALRKSEAHLRQVELRAAHEAFDRERDTLDRFFVLSLDMLCVLDAAGRIERINPSFRALGYDSDAIIGMDFFALFHPDDVARHRDIFNGLAQGAGMAQKEARFRRADGTFRWLSWSIASDAAGALYGVGRDITDARRATLELQSAKESAELAGRELEAFSYSVAHDLRAPLRAIDGFSQALVEDYAHSLDAAGQAFLSRTRRAAQRMAQLIDDLLLLSRLSRTELQPDAVDIAELARNVVERLREMHPARDIEIIVPDVLSARADPRLLTIALENLIGNAWKFTGHTLSPRIEIGREMRPEGVAYFVRDNGAGFDMAYADKLFGPFQRLHGSEEFEGTGIGLATVQRIIHRHRGRVWPEASIGGGACFRFTLGMSPSLTSPDMQPPA